MNKTRYELFFEETGKKLTEKERLFTEYFANDNNATKAMDAAGYKVNSEGGKRSLGSRTLNRAKIQAYLAFLGRKVAEKLEITHERITKGLLAIAELDPKDYMDDEGFKNIKDIPESVRKTIMKIKLKKSPFGNETELIVADRMKAWDMLAKHIGFYQADNKLDLTSGGQPINPAQDLSNLSDEELLVLAGIHKKLSKKDES